LVRVKFTNLVNLLKICKSTNVTEYVHENMHFYLQLLILLNICWRKGVKKIIKENETEIFLLIYFQVILLFLRQLEKGGALPNFLMTKEPRVVQKVNVCIWTTLRRDNFTILVSFQIDYYCGIYPN